MAPGYARLHRDGQMDSQFLSVLDSVQEDVDLREKIKKNRSWTQLVNPFGKFLAVRLTSYFCLFIFSVSSNFSDSSWWMQSHISLALCLKSSEE